VTDNDPTCTDPDKYRMIFENDAVRVLEYHDSPGAVTAPHRHPDSVMYTLTAFARRLRTGGATRDVEMDAGEVHWLPAQVHSGENVGSTDTRVVFIELKTTSAGPGRAGTVGPST
jgi:beta-alanine degradation protein BauB